MFRYVHSTYDKNFSQAVIKIICIYLWSMPIWGIIKLVCLLEGRHSLWEYLTKSFVTHIIGILGTDMDEKDILDVNQAAEMLGISLSTFHRRIKSKLIAPGHRLGKGPMYWFKDELIANIDDNGMTLNNDELL